MYGLGIQHWEQSPSSASSGPARRQMSPRPVPHARMYHEQEGAPTDLFMSSRPPGNSVALPPHHYEAATLSANPQEAVTPHAAQDANDFSPMMAGSTYPDTQDSLPTNNMHESQTSSFSVPEPMPATASMPPVAVQTTPTVSLPSRASDGYVPTVVQVGPPSAGISPMPSSAEQTMPIAAPATNVDDTLGPSADYSFKTAPVAHTEAMHMPASSHVDTNMESFTDSADVSADRAFGVDALIRPYDMSGDSLSHDLMPTPSHQSSPNPHNPFRMRMYPQEPFAEESPSFNQEVHTHEVVPIGVRAHTNTHEHVLASTTSPTLTSTMTVPTLPPSNQAVQADRPMPAINLEQLSNLGPVVPSTRAAWQVPSDTQDSTYTVRPDHYDQWKAPSSMTPSITTPAVAEMDIPTAHSKETDEPVMYSQRMPVNVAATTETSTSREAAAFASAPTETSSSTGPRQQDTAMASTVGMSAADLDGSARAKEEPKDASPVPNESTSLTPILTQSELSEPSKDTYRVEWMLGMHTQLFDDACTSTQGPVPVAYTYDEWYIEPVHDVMGARPAGPSAIVANSPPPGQAAASPLYLGVFGSELRTARDGRYVLDLAHRVAFDVQPNRPLPDNTRAMSLSTCVRHARIFSYSPRVVLAATPHRLVAEMTSGSSPGLMQDVFLGYRQYFGASRLLDLLLSRMEWAITKVGETITAKTAMGVLVHTQSALWYWLQYYYDRDFARNETLLRRLIDWTADQDFRTQFWKFAEEAKHSVNVPHLLPLHEMAIPELDDEMTTNDPCDRMHVLWALVQGLVPASMLPTTTPGSSGTNVVPSREPMPELHKVRSLTRMLSLSNSPRKNKRGGHGRKPSNTISSAVMGAVNSMGTIPAVPGTRQSQSQDFTTGTASPVSGVSLDTPDVSQSSLHRNRSVRSLRRLWRRGDGSNDEPSTDDARQHHHHTPALPFGSRRTETQQAAEEALDTDDGEQDATLQRLETALSDLPSASDVISPQQRSGPIQWIPSHTGASWKEAQRMSILSLQSPRFGDEATRTTAPTQPDTFLLYQRSSTIARQLGSIEREIMACVRWTDMAEPAWDQHTIQQEQWQREYQEYTTMRIRAATEGSSVPQDGSRTLQLNPTRTQQGVHMLIARFNRACAWVATHIVTTKDLEQRAAIVNKFIRIAWHCYRQGNIETLCQIMFGLQSPWVARLQKTWARVALWELRAFDALRRFTSPRNQFVFLRQSMREALDSSVSPRRFSEMSTTAAPYVPFFGLFVTDLSAVDGLNSFVDSSLMPNMTPFYDDQELSQSWDTLVNVYRLRLKALIVREFITFQRHEREAPEHPMELPILIEALHLDTLSAVAIQRASFALEP